MPTPIDLKAIVTSVGGVLTGRGADVIIIDDPQKPDEALSEAGRRAVNDWYDNTLLSHVLPQDDWTVVSFPAIAEEKEEVVYLTPYGSRKFVRRSGEALHPERESVQEYNLMRGRIGLYNFSSQYQQRPIPLSGNLIGANGCASMIRTANICRSGASFRAGTPPARPRN